MASEALLTRNEEVSMNMACCVVNKTEMITGIEFSVRFADGSDGTLEVSGIVHKESVRVLERAAELIKQRGELVDALKTIRTRALIPSREHLIATRALRQVGEEL